MDVIPSDRLLERGRRSGRLVVTVRPVCHHPGIIRDDVTCETLIIHLSGRLSHVMKDDDRLECRLKRQTWMFVSSSDVKCRAYLFTRWSQNNSGVRFWHFLVLIPSITQAGTGNTEPILKLYAKTYNVTNKLKK